MIFAKTTEVLAEVLVSSSEGEETLGQRVSRIKTKDRAFGYITNATNKSVLVSGEVVEVTQTFTCLGSAIHSSTGCGPKVNRRLGGAWSAMNRLEEGVWRYRYLKDEGSSFRTLVLPVLLYSCET